MLETEQYEGPFGVETAGGMSSVVAHGWQWGQTGCCFLHVLGFVSVSLIKGASAALVTAPGKQMPVCW